jgi:hypothetical protein
VELVDKHQVIEVLVVEVAQVRLVVMVLHREEMVE